MINSVVLGSPNAMMRNQWHGVFHFRASLGSALILCKPIFRGFLENEDAIENTSLIVSFLVRENFLETRFVAK